MINKTVIDNLSPHKQQITVSVIGGHDITHEVEQKSYNIGKIIAEVGAILICGGLSGVMEAASRGAKSAGGTTIGLLPGINKADANPYIDIALPTSIGYARNAFVAASADIIIALPGSHGTNSEICYGLVFKRPVIDVGNWNIKGMIKPKNLEDVKPLLKKLIEQIQKG